MDKSVDYHQFMNVNYYGCVYLTLAALPYLQQTAGRITVVSSLGGLIPYPRQTFYNVRMNPCMGVCMELLTNSTLHMRMLG